MEVLQAYYPEFVGEALCINVPPLFVHLWRVLSAWLSPAMRRLVAICDAERTPPAIAKLAPPASLPRVYGGECAPMPPDVRVALGLDGLSARQLASLFGPGKLAAYAGT